MTPYHRLQKAIRINRWMAARHERKEANQKQLALYYASRAWPEGGKPDTSWFHLFHNWTIGVERWKTNIFAHKALEAWYNVGKGHYAKRSKVWQLAFAKYVQNSEA